MPTITNFAQAQAALSPFYDNSRTPYTLDAMQALMQYLGNPQEKLRVLHVAGTSGKTSTAYYCAALLKASGHSVGLSVSPHIDTVNERLQIDASPIPEAEFCAVLSEFLELIIGAPVQPSYFELLVALAYWEFARRGVDYAVIEVGLGGLLDGTNVVTRADKVCIITDIGLDHTEILGDTLEEITAQKAGIIHRGNSVYMYDQGEQVMDVVRERVAKQQAWLRAIPAEYAVDDPTLPLFQRRNLGLAASAVAYTLGRDFQEQLSTAAIDRAAGMVIPARLERFTVNGKTVIIDGSHNQQKLRTLLDSLRVMYPDQPIAILCSFVAGPASRWQGGMSELLKAADYLIFTSFSGEQDMPKSSVAIDEFAAYCSEQGFSAFQLEPDPAKAFSLLLARPEPVLVVTGSFYLLNHIRPMVKEDS